MKIENFEEYLYIHGSDIESWDGDIKEAALKLLSESEEAVALHKEIEGLDNELDHLDTPAPSENLYKNIMNGIESVSQEVPSNDVLKFNPKQKSAFSNPFVWTGFAAVAAALVLFFAVSSDVNVPGNITPVTNNTVEELPLTEEQYLAQLEVQEEVDEFINDLFSEEAEELDIYDLL